MIHTAVVTDTNSGISVAEGEELGIYVLPMPVIVDGHEYTEGMDISHDDLFAAMQAEKAVMTSQPSIEDVRALWEKALENGAEEVPADVLGAQRLLRGRDPAGSGFSGQGGGGG